MLDTYKTKLDRKKQSTSNTTKKTKSNQKNRPPATQTKTTRSDRKKLSDLDHSRKTMCIIKKKSTMCIIRRKSRSDGKKWATRIRQKKPCVLLKNQIGPKNSAKTMCIIRRKTTSDRKKNEWPRSDPEVAVVVSLSYHVVSRVSAFLVFFDINVHHQLVSPIVGHILPQSSSPFDRQTIHAHLEYYENMSTSIFNTGFYPS